MIHILLLLYFFFNKYYYVITIIYKGCLIPHKNFLQKKIKKNKKNIKNIILKSKKENIYIYF